MRLGVYVQVPFCQTKCTYCNFHTGVFSSDLYAPYVDAVCREISTLGGVRIEGLINSERFELAGVVVTSFSPGK